MLTRKQRSAMVVFALAGALFLAGGSAMAEVIAYKIMNGEAIAESLTGKPGDPANGKKVLLNRKKGNCLACHTSAALSDQPFHGEVGTTLDGASERMSVGELRLRIVNPKVANKDTIMPAFYRTEELHRVMKKFQGKAILSAQEVEDVIAYVLTLKE